jgi:putative membrane protein
LARGSRSKSPSGGKHHTTRCNTGEAVQADLPASEPHPAQKLRLAGGDRAVERPVHETDGSARATYLMADERDPQEDTGSESPDERDVGGGTISGGESEDSGRNPGPRRELAEDRTDWAEERTDWAKERTLLAKQRTFAAWLRTGLTSAAVGFGVAEFLGELEPRWVVMTASALLVIAGAVIFVIGFLGYRETFRKLQEEGVQGIHPWIIGGVTSAMLLGALLLLYSVLRGSS